MTGLRSKVASRMKVASLLTLRWRDHLGLSGRAQGHHKGLHRWRTEGRTLEGCVEKDSPGHRMLSWVEGAVS